MKLTKQTIILTILILCFGGAEVFAYDIEVKNADGVLILYNYINDGMELEVANVDYYAKSVVIPEEITYMNRTLKVTKIGDEALYSKPRLFSITIPNSVTSIGKEAFAYCSGLTTISFGNSVTTVGEAAFYSCTGLTSITIPNSVTSIGERAFMACKSLTSITIPNSVTSIGQSAFSNCTGLVSVSISNSVTSIDDRVFETCSNLCSITIPSSVKSIGEFTFALCKSLTSITIPNSVTSIGNFAFYECSGLTTITIPNSVTSIGEWAFSGCTGLTSIELHCEEITNCFKHLESLQIVVIGDEVKSIGQDTFSDCTNLVSVLIGSSVTSIGYHAFNNTKIKKTVWLTNTPPSGSNYAVGAVNYVSNEQYSINNKVVYPFLSSYFDVDGIRYVPVSPSERTCDAIDCVYDSSASNTMINSTVSYHGITMNVMKVQPYICYGNKFIENLTCDNDGAIAQYAFYGCENIKTVTLGEKITSFGDYAFSDCYSLQAMVIPNSVTELGKYSLSECKQITKLNIPKSVTAIKDYSFSGCTGLKEFIIEDREDELILGSNGSFPMFSACPLDNVYIGGNISYNTQQKYGYSPFYRNTTLREVVITDKETEISENEFYGCTNLKSFKIGDGVEKFGDWAFSGCSSLESLSFGTQLKTIGKEAFSDCVSVTEITSKATTPPNCGIQALDDINKWNCKLFVPKGSLSQYQAADQWKDFFFISESIINSLGNVRTNALMIQSDENVLNISGVPEGEEIIVYNISGQKVGSTLATCDVTNINTTLKSGEIGIVKIGDKSVKVIIK